MDLVIFSGFLLQLLALYPLEPNCLYPTDIRDKLYIATKICVLTFSPLPLCIHMLNLS